MDDVFVDGNTLGGALRTVFAMELTDAIGQCNTCGRRRVLAEARVYTHAPGLVARCVFCGNVLLRLVEGPERTWIDCRGLSVIELPSALP
jgi:Family of unknown function (DUF6510)